MCSLESFDQTAEYYVFAAVMLYHILYTEMPPRYVLMSPFAWW